MLKQKYFLTGIFILSAERQPIKLSWRKIVWLLNYMRIIFKKFRTRMIVGCILAVIALLAVSVVVFINQPSFGRTPRGERLERVMKSPNYRN